jgi:hypothetical protein
VQSVEGGYGATVGETGPEEPDEPIVPGARFYDLVPVRELPYGPAAPSLHQRPDRWQHPTTCRSSSKTACTWWGVHRWVHGLVTTCACKGGIQGVVEIVDSVSTSISPWFDGPTNDKASAATVGCCAMLASIGFALCPVAYAYSMSRTLLCLRTKHCASARSPPGPYPGAESGNPVGS